LSGRKWFLASRTLPEKPTKLGVATILTTCRNPKSGPKHSKRVQSLGLRALTLFGGKLVISARATSS